MPGTTYLPLAAMGHRLAVNRPLQLTRLPPRLLPAAPAPAAAPSATARPLLLLQVINDRLAPYKQKLGSKATWTDVITAAAAEGVCLSAEVSVRDQRQGADWQAGGQGGSQVNSRQTETVGGRRGRLPVS